MPGIGAIMSERKDKTATGNKMPDFNENFAAPRLLVVEPIPDADPGNPHEVFRSHLKKEDLGKSSSSCRLSFLTRPHRNSMVQEVWCQSFEEKEVVMNIAANPDVLAFREQAVRVDYLEGATKRHTRVDLHVAMRDGTKRLVSTKYDEKARRQSYRDQVKIIAMQSPRAIADRFVVVSRFSFHPVYRACAEAIHVARLGWDPEADRIVLEAANDDPGEFTFGDMIERSRLGARGYRAAVRLIGDGDVFKPKLAPIANDTVCRGTAK